MWGLVMEKNMKNRLKRGQAQIITTVLIVLLVLVSVVIIRSINRGSVERGGVEKSSDCNVKFYNTEFLANPTSNSIQVSLVPMNKGDELYIEYGELPGTYTKSTNTLTTINDSIIVFTLTGLEPNKTYYYRTRYRTRCSINSTIDFGARQEYSFKTKKPEDETFSFAFSTDSHGYQKWARYSCGKKEDLFVLNKTIENILLSKVDFLILGGDEVQTHCNGCPSCAEFNVDGEYPGQNNVQSQREAELRYRVLRRLFEPTVHSVPLFYTLGNHDGESTNYNNNLLINSLNARLKYMANPYSVYGGGEDGNYFSFEWGDGLFIILDVIRYSTDHWTLGSNQLQWLSTTLKNSNKKWKFLFSHHLVGGDAYGRGGLRSTDNNLINGTFTGEQAIVHQIMKDTGAQFFIYGHDHAFSFGEKLSSSNDPEGIYYITGGMPSETVKPTWWGDLQNFYDYNYDGKLNDALYGEKGFTKITVYGKHNVTIEYIGTKDENIDPEINPETNMQTIFKYTILGPKKTDEVRTTN
jgi:hypothetical protein